MSSIGPQLPPHLTKRKRSPEDADDADSPPAKVTRPSNDAEISLNSDSEDDYGPSAAPNKTAAPRVAQNPTIGPTLPSSANNNDERPLNSSRETEPNPSPRPARSIGPTLPPQPSNHDEIALDSSDDDAGPAPPKRSVGPTLPPSEPKRIHGPSMPPAPLSERPPTDPDSDSDSDYGPALPSSSSAQHTNAGPSQPQASLPEPSAPQRRDDWMIAPPPPSNSAADPLRIKARGFSSNPRGGGGGTGVPGEISSLWTETADEKRKRLADQVLGRAPAGGSAGPSATDAASLEKQQRDRAAEERDARMRAEVEASRRGKSLYEEHQTSRRKDRREKGGGGATALEDEDEDDPSKRAFDWEKDMRVGSGLSHSQRKDMVNRSANFGGRFQKGSFL